MRDRQVRDFVRAALGAQAATGVSMERAKYDTAQMLGVDIPDAADFNRALTAPLARRRRGRQHCEGLSKRDAVAAVAVYFESIGAGVEQAITEAQRWLGIAVSRRVAKAAVGAYKGNTGAEQYKGQALWAYGTFKPGTTLPLPATLTYTRRKRRAKSDLG